MSPFPDIPEDDESDWGELEALAEQYPLVRPMIEALRAETERLFEAMAADSSEVARLSEEAKTAHFIEVAKKLEGESLPYLWGGDAVRWAEEITRQAAESSPYAALAERHGPYPPKRLGPLRRIEERVAGPRPRRPLRRLLRAAKRLTNRRKESP